MDPPDPGEGVGIARVAVRRAGVYNTDLELVKGWMGGAGLLGHEFGGVVDKGPDKWLGRRVAAEINFACGRCATCPRSLPLHCPTRRVVGIRRMKSSRTLFRPRRHIVSGSRAIASELGSLGVQHTA